MDTSSIWLGIGFLGQAIFSARFILQWIVSERRRKSVTPVAFWYFSLGGGVILLSYAIHRRDTVFIVGQAAGLVVYVRNIMLIRPGAGVRSDDAQPPAADATER